MKKQKIKAELLTFLTNDYIKPKVTVMPDFFFDRIINFDYDIAVFLSEITKVAKQKGGSLDGISQIDLKGGNAINTTYALAALGAKVIPIVCTNNQGIKKIRSDLGQYNIDLSHIKLEDKASITTSLELKVENKTVNIMLRDLGDLANFQFSHLNNEDNSLIEDADYVCLFNWAGTRNYGTKLATKVFSRVKRRGKGKTYYDTADPNPNAKGIPELVKKVLMAGFIDILSVNENEAISYASYFDEQIQKKNGKKINAEISFEAAKVLAKKLNARIDLHTSNFSATIKKKKEVRVRTFNIKPLRTTGAGDAWNAGNIIADANFLSAESRLILANAVSACYLTNLKGRYPNRKTLIAFIEKEFTNNLFFS